jgi:hypothetical protein
MRTVLIGSDFMYDKDGNLKPIEINTAVGWSNNKFETDDESIDLSQLTTFVQTQAFTKVYYIGALKPINEKVSAMCSTLGIEYEFLKVDASSLTVPNIEDNEQTLIIRSAYDTTAIVDDTYCKDKVNFLNLIKDSTFSAQFAYKNENGELVNNITTINDNGAHPNFLLKAVAPNYDKTIYPKFFKVSTQEELDIVLQNVDENYFLMEFYLNMDNLYQNHIKVIRSMNILYPSTLQSIPIGVHTTFCNGNLTELPSFNTETFELQTLRNNYTSIDNGFVKPKLEDSDLVQMEDGSFKSASDLQVGDMVRTIDIPNIEDVENNNDNANYRITIEQLQSGTTYTTNEIILKERRFAYTKTKKIIFTDATEWEDTEGSIYLSYRNNEVRFLSLNENITNEDDKLKIGDNVILIDTTNETIPNFVMKEVQSIERVSGFFGGWVIGVDIERLFLTKSPDSDASFVAIEHNVGCAAYGCYQTVSCPKFASYCCGPVSRCVTGCNNCPQY